MSFLDEQASGQIGIGEKANLGTLTRTRRKRKKGQRPQGTETYSLLPQNEFTDIVSSPTDITQVGIGQLLTAQGIPAAQVRNVFERYQDTGAAPIGDVGDVLYPQPEDDGDDDDDNDDDIETQTDPYIPDADPGLGEGNPLGGTSAFNSINDLVIAAQKAGLVKGKTGYESKDPEAGGYGFQATLPPTASKAYEDYTFGTGEGEGSMGAGTGGRGGPTLSGLTPTAIAALGLTGQISPSVSSFTPDAPPAAAPVAPPSVGTYGYSDTSGGDTDAEGSEGGADPGGMGSEPGGMSYSPAVDVGDGEEWGGINVADGGVITKSKAKNKNSFMSMKGK